MENPHAERQNVLLQRIIKNADKCTETVMELNHCLEEIIRANAHVKIAADLATKYRKNVQYNLEATRAAEGEVTVDT
ncbi:DASH complex subunit Dad4 [Fomitopsis schrenkii]|uniref:DASH complex subunit DAD4 n=1 Tax=Fomitopsis schrenkii TaxID=2126942 RepID=S8EBH6_FOMSC|nr:DASH complex subunit Dad4 [Fomitopsis schrenkii]